jgi:release factor glutamine methyltransferase
MRMQNQTRQKAITAIKHQLSPHFSPAEIQAMNFWFIDALEHSPESNWENLIRSWLDALLRYTPIQYIFNRAFFGKLELFVNEHTLIPRPETEELCELILNHPRNSDSSEHQLLDIGTGSGCIPIWLKYNRCFWDITAIDISEEALKVAKQNAAHHQLDIAFKQENFLAINSIEDKYSIIISNPPYIPKKELSRLNKNVIDFEPHLALFVEDNDPLIFYKKIANLFETKKRLRQIWLEIDPETAEENCALFNKMGVAQIIIDYSGNPRFILCERTD